MLLLIPAVKLSFHLAPSREVRVSGHLHIERPWSWQRVSGESLTCSRAGQARRVRYKLCSVWLQWHHLKSLSHLEYLQKKFPAQDTKLVEVEESFLFEVNIRRAPLGCPTSKAIYSPSPLYRTKRTMGTSQLFFLKYIPAMLDYMGICCH